MSHHEHDPELIECRECDSEFDLARQHYYDDICPSCRADGRGEINCVRCATAFRAGTGHTVRSSGAIFAPDEMVTVCSAECAQKINPNYTGNP